MSVIGEFRVGEDIAVALDAVSGEVDSVDTVTAKIRPAIRNGGSLELDFDASATDMAVSARDADGDIPAGWTLSLSAAQTAGMDEGYYGIDAKLVIGSGTDITDQTAFIRFTKAAM